MTPYRPTSKSMPGIVARSFGSEVPFHPFLLVDHFVMDRDVFPPHRHAGISVLTYLLPESETALRNRDDIGSDLLIEPGGLHWTTAGAGIVHHEAPVDAGAKAIGLQIFIALPADGRHQAPGILDIAATDVPTMDLDGARVRSVVGRFGPLASPMQPPVPVGIADIDLAPEASIDLAIPDAAEAFVFLERGTATIAGERLEEGEMARVPMDGAAPSIVAGAKGARALVFAASSAASAS